MNPNSTSMGNSIMALPPENNHYSLINFGDTNEKQPVVFYKLNPDGTHEEGTTLEEMLRVTLERITDLNRRFPCRENAIVITKLEESIMWLEKRTKDRKARGVEGKHIN